MRLVTIENYSLQVAPEALLIRPIRRLWNQDRSERKDKFYQQMSYIYFMNDPRSSYSYLLDEQERSKAIIEQEGLPSDFKPSGHLLEAMEIYKQHTITVSQRLLNDALVAANKIGTFLREIDLNAEDDKGKPKYQISSIVTSLKNLEGVVASIQSLQKKVDSELAEEEGKARGDQELTIGDIGLD